MEKTKEELVSELRVLDQLKEERKKSDELYAIKLVEKIVFALVSLLLITVAGAIIKLVVL
jgi:hypothetical protein